MAASRGRACLLGAAALALSACADPRAQCLAAADAALVAQDTAIATARGNLARGHALRETTVAETVWTVCRTRIGATVFEETEGGDGPSFCFEEVPRRQMQAVAIDPVAERRSLAALEAGRPALSRDALAARSACGAP